MSKAVPSTPEAATPFRLDDGVKAARAGAEAAYQLQNAASNIFDNAARNYTNIKTQSNNQYSNNTEALEELSASIARRKDVITQSMLSHNKVLGFFKKHEAELTLTLTRGLEKHTAESKKGLFNNKIEYTLSGSSAEEVKKSIDAAIQVIDQRAIPEAPQAALRPTPPQTPKPSQTPNLKQPSNSLGRG